MDENGSLNLGEKRAASDMLEDALQHFDNIIDNTGNISEDDHFNEDATNELDNGLQGVALLMEDLRHAVEATVDAEVNSDEEKEAFSDALLRYISIDTLTFYRDLLKIKPTKEGENEKVSRLQNENQSLTLHVSILTDQIDLQTEKLNEVEAQLKEALLRLEGADARLQEEVAAKTNLETQKLQLMNEMSNYKIDLVQRQQQQRQDEVDGAEAERRRLEVEARNDQYKFLMGKLHKMKEKVYKLQQEKLEFSGKLFVAQKTIEDLEKELAVKDRMLKEIHSGTGKRLTSPDEGIVQDHDDKEHRLLRMPAPFATSTPISSEPTTHGVQQVLNDDAHDATKPVEELSTPTSAPPIEAVRCHSLERLHGVRLAGGDINSSPRDDVGLKPGHMGGSSGAITKVTPNSPVLECGPRNLQGKNPKSSSTPNLAITEIRPLPTSSDGTDGRGTPTRGNPQPNPFQQRKKHGFRKFFTSFKLRRSRSTSIDPDTMTTSASSPQDDDNFKRGGVRSTAGPRLGWNPRDHVNQTRSPLSSKTPFQHWDTDMVCRWLSDIGLDNYVDACSRWVKSGDTLLRATNHELEKELGVRHPLHKKKLMLHLQVLAGGDDDVEGVAQMNALWVARWLDDVGLPQYKDSFHEACVDGRTLHHLTVSDAHKLKVTNLFHLLSLRRGIEKLRSCNFDPTQLRRRPLGEGEIDDVSLWTNHRVMEWLRMADLAEYAPNLRGSGVHGATMVLEPMFTSETLAALLHIPMNKSLLRRHLAAKLIELLPEESIRLKEERSKDPGYQPLGITVKYKIGRRSFGGFGRFRGLSAGSGGREFGQGEYVCPILSSSSKTMSGHRDALEKKIKMVEIKENRDTEAMQKEEQTSAENIEVVELNESTTREINAFSAQINSLTNNWTEK